jgi:hypothetical protein
LLGLSFPFSFCVFLYTSSVTSVSFSLIFIRMST